MCWGDSVSSMLKGEGGGDSRWSKRRESGIMGYPKPQRMIGHLLRNQGDQCIDRRLIFPIGREPPKDQRLEGKPCHGRSDIIEGKGLGAGNDGAT